MGRDARCASGLKSHSPEYGDPRRNASANKNEYPPRPILGLAYPLGGLVREGAQIDARLAPTDDGDPAGFWMAIFVGSGSRHHDSQPVDFDGPCSGPDLDRTRR